MIVADQETWKVLNLNKKFINPSSEHYTTGGHTKLMNYVLNDFRNGKIKAIIFDNKYDLNYVWNFNSEYQNFIHNKTDKYLYLEPRIYGYGVFTDKKIETIEIAPNQIISSSIPVYFFENEPPYSIKIPKGLSSVTQYWLHY